MGRPNHGKRVGGVVQKVPLLGNTDNLNFGWFAYDSTDGHPKKCYPILNHARKLYEAAVIYACCSSNGSASCALRATRMQSFMCSSPK